MTGIETVLLVEQSSSGGTPRVMERPGGVEAGAKRFIGSRLTALR